MDSYNSMLARKLSERLADARGRLVEAVTSGRAIDSFVAYREAVAKISAIDQMLTYYLPESIEDLNHSK